MTPHDKVRMSLQLAECAAESQGYTDQSELGRHLFYALILLDKAEEPYKELITACEAVIESLGGYNEEMDNLGYTLGRLKNG